MADHAAVPHALITGIEDQVGVGLVKMAVGKPGKGLVQSLVDGADGTGREAVTAQFLRNGLDLAGGNALHIHLRQCRHQRFLAPGVALEQGDGELAAPIPWHPQFELADPGDQVAAVIARPIPVSGFRAFSRFRSQKLGHLAFQHFLQRFFHQRLHQVAVARDRFHCRQLRTTLARGHGLPS